METFLQLVAHDLCRKVGQDLSRTVIIFPNKRAGLFFNEALAAEYQKPIWAPAYLTISELFAQLSPYRQADSIRLVCELYKVFLQQTGSTETLDDFYFWGELLISDFDDVDKNLVNADRLFTNLKDLKEMADNFDFLDEEQKEALQLFFHNFSPDKRTQLKDKFISIWNRLGGIYHHFRQSLAEQQIAYEGMLYREAIDHLQPDNLPYEHYVFVGFNVLNEVERKLFRLLQQAGKALFYWDYDIFYTDSPAVGLPSLHRHEAGEFIRRNLREFPNQLPAECFDRLSHPKQVTYLSASSEDIQARYLSQWVDRVHDGSCPEKQSAVVLCNEALLLPILHSLPSQLQHINITMGFPLAQTPVFSLVDALIELQTTGYRSANNRYTYTQVMAVLRHPYIRQATEKARALEQQLTQNNRFFPAPSELTSDELLQLIFTPQTGIMQLSRYLVEVICRVASVCRQSETEVLTQLYREAFFKAYMVLNRLVGLMEDKTLPEDIHIDTWRRLVNRLLSTTSIPFHGEPAIGMQIMGVLETRNLDFRNLLMLSVNEGRLPRNTDNTSFIPYNLRKAFGMTTIEHQNAVYAYYFYRLIQRAENITLVYNSTSGESGLGEGEMSRFLLQFQVEAPYPIRQGHLQATHAPMPGSTLTVDKTPQMVDSLQAAYDLNRNPRAYLSPSALNTYLDCPLKFYYRYVARLKQPDEVTTDIDHALFGTLFHRAAQLAYQDLTTRGEMVQTANLERLLKEEARVRSYVDAAFREKFFHIPANEKPEYNGIQLIHSSVITTYLKQLFRNDLRHAPFALKGMEQEVRDHIDIRTPAGRQLTLGIGGTIDRLDCKEGRLRIVDYKTGGQPAKLQNIEQLFTPDAKRPGYIFQTFLYADMVHRQTGQPVTPALLYIHRAASDDYSPLIHQAGEGRKSVPIDDFAPYADEFRQRLTDLLVQIFGEEGSFPQTEDASRCEYCDFRRLCQR